MLTLPETLDPMTIYILFAAGAAILAGLSPAFLKTGAKRGDSCGSAAMLLTVLAVFYACIALQSGEMSGISGIDRRSMLFLVAAGACDGVYWMCIFRALATGNVNRVVPIDNLSGLLVLGASWYLFQSALGIWQLCFVAMVVLGTILMLSRPQKAKSMQWLWFSLLAMVLAAGSTVLQRYGVSGVNDGLNAFVRCAVATALMWLVTFSTNGFKRMKKMGAENWIFVLVGAVSLGLAKLCNFYGAKFGTYPMLLPIALLCFPVTMLFAGLLHKEKMPGGAVFGMLLVLAGEAAMMYF